MNKKNLVLGTTKFGMDYGLADSTQKVLREELGQIFELCRMYKIEIFDTAPSYGDAEIILGEERCAEYAKIITKVQKINQSIIDAATVQEIESRFAKSLTNLQCDSLYGLLVHDVKDLLKPGAESLVNWLYKLRNKSVVSKIGVSVYSPEEARTLFQKFEFDLVQIPYNIFDQRFKQTETISWLLDREIEIHARSLFFKGLLLKPNIDPQLPTDLIEHHKKFHQYLNKTNVSAFEACLFFAKCNPQIDRWVIGVSTENQLEKLLSCKEGEVSNIQFEDWALNNTEVIDPRFW